MKYSEKLAEIANLLKLLTAKSESIEAALKDKADKTILDDFSLKLASVEDSVDKLTHCNVDLKKELTKSVEGIKHSNAKLGDSFQCKNEEKVGSIYMVFAVTVSSYPSIDHVLTSGRIYSAKGSSVLGTVFLKMSSMQLRSTHSRTV